MPLLQIFNSFSNFIDSFGRNAAGQSQVRNVSKQDISGSKRHLPEETIREVRRDNPLWNVSEGEGNSYAQQSAKRQRTAFQNPEPNKSSLSSKISPNSKFEQRRTSFGSEMKAHTTADLMGNEGGLFSKYSKLPTAPFEDVVYVRKSLLSPEQLQVAAATERAMEAHETLRLLRSKAISQTAAPSCSINSSEKLPGEPKHAPVGN
jgi:hypothetical protein